MGRTLITGRSKITVRVDKKGAVIPSLHSVRIFGYIAKWIGSGIFGKNKEEKTS
jgi:hypothetical protein